MNEISEIEFPKVTIPVAGGCEISVSCFEGMINLELKDLDTLKVEGIVSISCCLDGRELEALMGALRFISSHLAQTKYDIERRRKIEADEYDN